MRTKRTKRKQPKPLKWYRDEKQRLPGNFNAPKKWLDKAYWVFKHTGTGRNYYHGPEGHWEDETANARLLTKAVAVRLARKHKACVCGMNKLVICSFENDID